MSQSWGNRLETNGKKIEKIGLTEQLLTEFQVEILALVRTAHEEHFQLLLVPGER